MGGSMVSNYACRQCGEVRLRSFGRIPAADEFAGQPLVPAWPGGYLYGCPSCHLVARYPVRTDPEYSALYEAAPKNVWVSTGLRSDQRHVLQLLQKHSLQGDVLDSLPCKSPGTRMNASDLG